MIRYLVSNPDKVLIPLAEHLEIVLITLVISVLLAGILTVLSVEVPKLGSFLVQIFSLIYSIPSMALFALLIPLTGLGMPSAITVLVIYNQYLLLRNFLTGLEEVDPGVREAARGIGMTKLQILRRIQLPLARPAIYAGIRLAMVSTIGIATIASCINAGGLGDLLFSGMRTQNVVKILWGSVLSAGLAVAMDALLKLEEKRTATNPQAAAGNELHTANHAPTNPAAAAESELHTANHALTNPQAAAGNEPREAIPAPTDPGRDSEMERSDRR